MNALVANDSARDRHMQQKALESVGYSIKLVRNVAQASQYLRDVVNCALVLADWDPQCEYLALLRMIRDEPRYNGVRVIMIAPVTALATVPLALRIGVDDIVVKPCSCEVLCERARGVRREYCASNET